MFQQDIDTCNIMLRMLKYSFLGIGVGVSVYYFPSVKIDINTIFLIATIASLLYALLDNPLIIKENYYNHKNK